MGNMVRRAGGWLGGVLNLGLDGADIVFASDIDPLIEPEMKSAALNLKTDRQSLCISDFNLVGHRGGPSGTINFLSSFKWISGFKFLSSDQPFVYGPQGGVKWPTPDFDGRNMAGMHVLGKLLRKYACQNSCTIGVYSCTMGNSPKSMKDLAESSTCKVYGATSTVELQGMLGWWLTDEGYIARATPDGSVNYASGPVGQSNATWATMQMWGEQG